MKYLDSVMQPSSVFVLGGCLLPLEHKITLARGQGYRPVPNPLDALHLSSVCSRAASKYFRRLRLCAQFGNTPIARDSLYLPNEAYEPDESKASLEEYISSTNILLLSSIDQVNQQHTIFESLTRRNVNRKAVASLIYYLKDRQLLTVKADKNLGLCILDKSRYIELMTTYLHSSDFQRLSAADAWHRIREVKQHIHQDCDAYFPEDYLGRRGHIHRYITEKVMSPKPISPYALLKVHKLTYQQIIDGTIPSIRFIAPCFNAVTEAASRYLDAEVRPLFTSRSPYNLADSVSLIRLLESKRYTHSVALSVYDVEALYPSIPIIDGLCSLDLFLHECRIPFVTINFLMRLARHVMQVAIYRYAGQFFLQRKGTAMGSPFAVAFANIFLYMLEKELVHSWSIDGRLLLYKRLIDDIFVVFSHRDHAVPFWSAWNKLHKDIKVTGCISTDSVVMLDLTIYKGTLFSQTGYLDLKLYQKPLNRYAYIPFSSHHPLSSKSAWLNSELRRYVKNNSHFEGYLRDRRSFIVRLLARKYPISLITKACARVSYARRSLYLEPSIRRTRPRRPIMIVPHLPQVQTLKIPKVLNHFWDSFVSKDDYEWARTVRPLCARSGTPNLYRMLSRLLPS